MSSFSGLSTALSSLIAQRQALEVAGQNIANANTVGYTRQRANLQSIEALSAPTMYSTGLVAGHGVRLSSIERIGDIFLDARLRSETSGASFQAAQAKALSRLESTMLEPSDTGVAAKLALFWAGWQEVGNSPDDLATRNVLLGDAAALVSQISSGYSSVATQWSQLRTEASTLVTEVNTTAEAVAHLNEQIRSILVSGGSANELMDQRDQLITKLSGLVGASARERDDGTVDVMVSGNALVRGVEAKAIAVTGSRLMAEGITTAPVTLVWAAAPTVPLNATGGTLASHVAALAPASDGGLLAGAAKQWNDLATSLASTVNAVHVGGCDLAGDTGIDFFSIGDPPATSLKVAITDPRLIAAAKPGQGGYHGSNADEIAQLAAHPDGPDALWSAFVVGVGVQARAAEQRASVTESARATAEILQLSVTSVDLDEETVTMLAYQRAYEGAARVMTAIDEMLDVLINRTGVVGR